MCPPEAAAGVKFIHEEVLVRAQIIELGQLSTHAGKSELLRWLLGFKAPPRQTFFVHGEAGALDAFRDTISAPFHWQ